MAILRSTSTALALLVVTSAATAQAPANDDCANAATLMPGLTSVDNSIANTDGLPLDVLVCDMGAFGDEDIYNDVWYLFTPGTSGLWYMTTMGLAGFDTRLAVYDQATCPDDPANVIACNDDEIFAAPFEAGLTVNLNAGSTYLVRLGSFDAGTGGAPMMMDVNMMPPPPPTPPANDDCANAIALPSAFATTAYDASNATTDGADAAGFCDYGASGDEQNYQDIWFTYTPDVGGCTYITTLGLAGYDTRLTIYDGYTCPDSPADIIACVDDEIIPVGPPFEAGLDVELVAGTTYTIRLGTFGPADVPGPGDLMIAAGPGAQNNGENAAFGAPGCAPAPTYDSACNGDGGNQAGCTDCPCGNNAPPGTEGGCLNSASTSAQLVASGSASVTAPDPDDLRFDANGLVPASFAVLTSGNAIAPANAANPCFGLNSGVLSAVLDGLRCAVQSTQRHGGRPVAADGSVGSSTNGWGGASGPPAGLAAQGGFAPGQTRHYQVFYRELPGMVCLTEQNTTQAVTVTFTP